MPLVRGEPQMSISSSELRDRHLRKELSFHWSPHFLNLCFDFVTYLRNGDESWLRQFRWKDLEGTYTACWRWVLQVNSHFFGGRLPVRIKIFRSCSNLKLNLTQALTFSWLEMFVIWDYIPWDVWYKEPVFAILYFFFLPFFISVVWLHWG